MAESSVFAKLSDDVVLKIFSKVEEDPRHWARLACVCTKFSSLIRHVCWRTKCSRTIPALVADLLDSSPSSADWSSLYKLSVCCPGLRHSGVLLEHSDFGLELELGPDDSFPLRRPHSSSPLPPLPPSSADNANCSWSLFDDLYFDTVYDASESTTGDGGGGGNEDAAPPAAGADSAGKSAVAEREEGCDSSVRKKRRISRSLRSHLASGAWNLSREQGNKLLASRFRGDCLYICDWPGCVHIEEKRNYMLFRGIFKNFKQSRVWRTIHDGNRKKIDVNCAFCGCKQTWDLHSAFCLRRVFGYHDDGEPVVRAYVCENGHVSDFQGAYKMLIRSAFSLVAVLLNFLVAVNSEYCYRKEDFPPGFVFGAATTAYLEDVQLMVKTGLDAYRFSISWSRLIPNHTLNLMLFLSDGRGPVNQEGLQYYANLINELISNGIQPPVTLHNYDLSQALEDEKDFTAFANVCFKESGDKVSYWATVNEPNALGMGGYDLGSIPPSRCTPPFGINCTKGNSSSEPYIAVHHILLAHASAARLYKKKYQGLQKGFIARDFMVGWIAHPLVFGDYPSIMKERAGSRLPGFSSQESKLVKGSFDFLGVIHYYTLTLPITPWGLQRVLEYLDKVYGNPPIYVYENGQQTRRNSSLEDASRVDYMRAFIGSLLDAVRGYFVWSFLDLLELLDGYGSSYGLYYVDLGDPELKRYPKPSAHWYTHFLKGKPISPDGIFKFGEDSSIL
ncbi:hypothetical protein Tsubulata_029360 [Turnera subulata]|uniref:F-box domain-containing protein n=1 Tax=Turnera subulata TaxID=218843 RepID=A0A9Q0F5K4_9ROSI|nr:hypothetical protein Tsubulata_029360 [Turnera subulata]